MISFSLLLILIALLISLEYHSRTVRYGSTYGTAAHTDRYGHRPAARVGAGDNSLFKFSARHTHYLASSVGKPEAEVLAAATVQVPSPWIMIGLAAAACQ